MTGGSPSLRRSLLISAAIEAPLDGSASRIVQRIRPLLGRLAPLRLGQGQETVDQRIDMVELTSNLTARVPIWGDGGRWRAGFGHGDVQRSPHRRQRSP